MGAGRRPRVAGHLTTSASVVATDTPLIARSNAISESKPLTGIRYRIHSDHAQYAAMAVESDAAARARGVRRRAGRSGALDRPWRRQAARCRRCAAVGGRRGPGQTRGAARDSNLVPGQLADAHAQLVQTCDHARSGRGPPLVRCRQALARNLSEIAAAWRSVLVLSMSSSARMRSAALEAMLQSGSVMASLAASTPRICASSRGAALHPFLSRGLE
jgi:hypothetical protein